jgi:hypothetical protein
LGSLDAETLRDLLEACVTPELLDLDFEASEAHLFPAGGRLVVLANELLRQREKLWLASARRSVVPPEELPNVEERHDQEIESLERLPLHRKSSIAVTLVTALHLHTNDSLALATRIRMYANQVVTLVARRSLVRQYVATKQVPHHEVLGSKGHDREMQHGRRHPEASTLSAAVFGSP